MATLIKQFTFVADTDILPNQVNANFDDVVAFLNNEVIHKDGSRAMTGALDLPNSDPVSANQAARKAYVDAREAAATGVANAAQTAANNAQSTANTAVANAAAAQGTANAALPSSKVLSGICAGTTNGAGDIFIIHNTNQTVKAVQLTRINNSNDCDWDGVVQFYNTNTVTIRTHNTNNGQPMPNIGISYFYTIHFA